MRSAMALYLFKKLKENERPGMHFLAGSDQAQPEKTNSKKRGGCIKKYVFKIIFSIFCILRFLNEAGATGRIPDNSGSLSKYILASQGRR